MKRDRYQGCLDTLSNRRGILRGTQEYENLKSHCELMAQSGCETSEISQNSDHASCGCQFGSTHESSMSSQEPAIKMTTQEEIAHIIKTAKEKVANETDRR